MELADEDIDRNCFQGEVNGLNNGQADMMAKGNIETDTILIPCRADSYSERITDTGSVYVSIENKPFRIYTSFFIGSKDKLEKELKRKENIDISKLNLDDEKTFSGITVPCTTQSGHSFVLIWMPEFRWTLEDFETLSHECLHATIMVMRMSGVRSKIFSAETDESCDDEGICYSQSSMFLGILTELVKKQNKVFKKEISKNKRKSKPSKK